MKPILIAGALALGLSGCAPLLSGVLTAVGQDPAKAQEIEDATIGNVVRPIPVYCTAPGTVRDQLRLRINGHANMRGHQIGVWCDGDPPLTLGAP